MKTVDMTLYDLFGYLIPGCVGLAAIYLVAWRIALPAIQDWNGVTAVGWIVVAGTAYITGHFLQALSNTLSFMVSRILKRNPVKDILRNDTCIPRELFEKAARFVREIAWDGIEAKEGSRDKKGRRGYKGSDDTMVIYDIMDNYVQQFGKIESRDVYVYREGFYRGLTVGFTLLALSSLVLMTRGQATLNAFGVTVTLTGALMIFVAIASLIVAVLAYFRYERFLMYRVRNSLYSFLSIYESTKSR